jgi:hypothetical protein
MTAATTGTMYANEFAILADSTRSQKNHHNLPQCINKSDTETQKENGMKYV